MVFNNLKITQTIQSVYIIAIYLDFNVYMQAINYLEKAKDMDKTMEFKSVWAYSLYTCCYRALGPDDAKTKEAEMLTK